MRWNHLLRVKTHSRFLPFLLPPPDFTAAELDKKRIAGTCEAQICRSCGPWSMGTAKHIEHSIQTAYVKAIQLSDYFVYIEVRPRYGRLAPEPVLIQDMRRISSS